MEYGKMKLVELCNVARDKGLRRWTALGKNALIRFLEDNNMFMELEQEIASLRQQQAVIPPPPPPPLRPTPYVVPPPPQTTTTAVRNKWYDWLVSHTPKTARKRYTVVHNVRKKKIMSLYGRYPPTIPVLVSSAIKKNTAKWKISGDGYKDPLVFFNNVRSAVGGVINGVSGTKKVYTVLLCLMGRENPKTGVTETTIMHAKSKTRTITTDFDTKYTEIVDMTLENISRFVRRRCGWRLRSIVEFEIFVVSFEPLGGEGYSGPIPTRLKGKHAIINMKNNNDECFKWAVTRASNPVE